MSACLSISDTISGEEPNYKIFPKSIKDGKRKIKEILPRVKQKIE